jgi:replicative DNA helicase
MTIKEDTREFPPETLPASTHAERTILGAILLDNAAHTEAVETLTEDDFSLDSHRRIFLRMTELMNENHAVDIVTLSEKLFFYKERDSIGGVAYLASLTEGLPRRPRIKEYIAIIKEKAKLRRIMLVCSAAIAQAADQSTTASDIVEQLGIGVRGIKEKRKP